MNGIQNGYKGIGVSIIGYTKHPAKVMWDMLKQTWIELQNIEYDPNLPIVREFITGSLERPYGYPLSGCTLSVDAWSDMRCFLFLYSSSAGECLRSET